MLVFGGITPLSCSGTCPRLVSLFPAFSMLLSVQRIFTSLLVGDLCIYNVETGIFLISASCYIHFDDSSALMLLSSGEWMFPSAAGSSPGTRYYHRAVCVCICFSFVLTSVLPFFDTT
jgi:hypothetical protein